jgi:hypothetical protein
MATIKGLSQMSTHEPFIPSVKAMKPSKAMKAMKRSKAMKAMKRSKAMKAMKTKTVVKPTTGKLLSKKPPPELKVTRRKQVLSNKVAEGQVDHMDFILKVKDVMVAYLKRIGRGLLHEETVEVVVRKKIEYGKSLWQVKSTHVIWGQTTEGHFGVKAPLVAEAMALMVHDGHMRADIADGKLFLKNHSGLQQFWR